MSSEGRNAHGVSIKMWKVKSGMKVENPRADFLAANFIHNSSLLTSHSSLKIPSRLRKSLMLNIFQKVVTFYVICAIMIQMRKQIRINAGESRVR